MESSQEPVGDRRLPSARRQSKPLPTAPVTTDGVGRRIRTTEFTSSFSADDDNWILNSFAGCQHDNVPFSECMKIVASDLNKPYDRVMDRLVQLGALNIPTANTRGKTQTEIPRHLKPFEPHCPEDAKIWALYCTHNDLQAISQSTKTNLKLNTPRGQVSALARQLGVSCQYISGRVRVLVKKFLELQGVYQPEQMLPVSTQKSKKPLTLTLKKLQLLPSQGYEQEEYQCTNHTTRQDQQCCNVVSSSQSSSLSQAHKIHYVQSNRENKNDEEKDNYVGGTGTITDSSCESSVITSNSDDYHISYFSDPCPPMCKTTAPAKKPQKRSAKYTPIIKSVNVTNMTSNSTINNSSSNNNNSSDNNNTVQIVTQTKKLARRSGDKIKFTAGDDTTIWNAYVAQDGPDIPPPRRCKVISWHPPESFALTLAQKLHKPESAILQRMKQLFRQYHWSQGRFHPTSGVSSASRYIMTHEDGDENSLLSFALSIGDDHDSIPDINDLADCDNESRNDRQNEDLISFTDPQPSAPSALALRRSPRISRSALPQPDSPSVKPVVSKRRKYEDTDALYKGQTSKKRALNSTLSGTLSGTLSSTLRRFTPEDDDFLWKAYLDEMEHTTRKKGEFKMPRDQWWSCMGHALVRTKSSLCCRTSYLRKLHNIDPRLWNRPSLISSSHAPSHIDKNDHLSKEGKKIVVDETSECNSCELLDAFIADNFVVSSPVNSAQLSVCGGSGDLPLQYQLHDNHQHQHQPHRQIPKLQHKVEVEVEEKEEIGTHNEDSDHSSEVSSISINASSYSYSTIYKAFHAMPPVSALYNDMHTGTSAILQAAADLAGIAEAPDPAQRSSAAIAEAPSSSYLSAPPSVIDAAVPCSCDLSVTEHSHQCHHYLHYNDDAILSNFPCNESVLISNVLRDILQRNPGISSDQIIISVAHLVRSMKP